MAVIANTSLAANGQISPTSILVGTSGDTLTYNTGTNQLLILYNTDTLSRTITINGAGGTAVKVPGAGAATFSVAAGVTYTIAAGASAVVRLDTISAYCQGVVAITADVAAKVVAAIVY